MTDPCPLRALDRQLAALAAAWAVEPLPGVAAPAFLFDAIPGAATDADTVAPRRALVLGEGGGGAGWAAALARVGIETVLMVADSADHARLDDLMTRAAQRDPALVPFALTMDAAQARGAGLLVLTDTLAPGVQAALQALGSGAVVIAAGDLDLLRRLDAIVPAARPLIGLHLPPAALHQAGAGGLVEVMPLRRDAHGQPLAHAHVQARAQGRTQAHALAGVQALARRMGRVPVVLPPGMPSPARVMLGHLTACADVLLMSGATPWDLDDAMQAGGWAQGLFLMEDQAGIDQMVALRHAHAAVSGRAVAPIAPRMLAEGRLGRQGGVGWYRYPGGGGPVIDPLMEDMCTEEAHFARWPRAVPGPAVMRVQLVLAVIDAALGLADSLAPAVPDRIARLALGFPAALGGPLALALRLGAALQAPLGALAASAPERWAGAPERLAAFLQAAKGSAG